MYVCMYVRPPLYDQVGVQCLPCTQLSQNLACLTGTLETLVRPKSACDAVLVRLERVVPTLTRDSPRNLQDLEPAKRGGSWRALLLDVFWYLRVL